MNYIFISACLIINLILLSCTPYTEIPPPNSYKINNLEYYKKFNKRSKKTEAEKKQELEYIAIDDYLFNSYDTPKNMKKEKIQLGAEIGMEAAVGVQDP